MEDNKHSITIQMIDFSINSDYKKDAIWGQILFERERQEAKWGQQNYPIVLDFKNSLDAYGIINEELAKEFCENAVKNKELTWGNIIIEELSEAIHAKTKEEQRKELVETAACCVAAIESLDRNGK